MFDSVGENTGPQIPLDPIELLTESHGIEEPFISKHFSSTVCAVVGVLSVCAGNWATRRPVWAGVQKHVLAGVVGYFVGQFINDRRNAYLAQRDAVYRHYIELHREDFPIPERKKFADVLEYWHPIR